MRTRDTDVISIASKVAWGFLGIPYKWGGNDPMAGFDCSGFVIEILKSVGMLPRTGDWSAEGLRDYFKGQAVISPVEGCLVFWSNSQGNKVIHVEYALNNYLTIGASGGGGSTVTVQDAIERDAYIKVRPYISRPNVACFRDPFLLRTNPIPVA